MRVDMTLADLSRILDLPASTVHFNINRLESRGFVSSYRTKEDRRKILYSNKSLMLFESTERISTSRDLEREAAIKHFRGSDDYAKNILLSIGSISLRFGIDMSPFLEKEGELFAMLRREWFEAATVTGTIDRVAAFVSKVGYSKVNVLSYDPPSFEIDTGSVFSDLSKIGTPLTGVMCRVLSQKYGKHYVVRKKEAKAGKLKLTLGVEEPYVDVFAPFIESGGLLFTKYAGGDKFVIFSNPEGPILIDNPSQVDLIRALRDNPSTLKEVVVQTGLPQSTAFVNLNKLHDLGIVSIAKDGVDFGSVIFTLIGDIILTRFDPDYPKINLKVQDTIGGDNPADYYMKIIRILVNSMEGLGIDTGEFHRYLGKCTGEVFVEQNPNMSPEDMLRSLTELRYGLGGKLVVESLIPVTIGLSYDNIRVAERKSNTIYFLSIIETMLSIKTGRKYRATSVTERSDSNYEMIFESCPDSIHAKVVR